MYCCSYYITLTYESIFSFYATYLGTCDMCITELCSIWLIRDRPSALHCRCVRSKESFVTNVNITLSNTVDLIHHPMAWRDPRDLTHNSSYTPDFGSPLRDNSLRRATMQNKTGEYHWLAWWLSAGNYNVLLVYYGEKIFPELYLFRTPVLPFGATSVAMRISFIYCRNKITRVLCRIYLVVHVLACFSNVQTCKI